MQEAAAAGVDAFLVVDLPIEEGGVLGGFARDHDVGLIPLLAPTSRAERVAAVRPARNRWPMPFLYYVSVTGVTGAPPSTLPMRAAARGTLARELSIPLWSASGSTRAKRLVSPLRRRMEWSSERPS